MNNAQNEDFLLDEEYDDKNLIMEEGASDEDEQGMFEHFRMNVDNGQTPLRVDKYMACHLMDTSRHRVQLAIKNGYVRVNDKVAKANLIIRPGDVIRFVMPYERKGFEVKPENIPLDIVYEDEDLLVVNKPAGMVVHPGHGHFEGTLINALSYHLGISQGEDAKDERMGVLVHRIDMDTSGLLVVAKNDESQLDLAGQFFRHTIERKYVAVVWGNLKEDEGTITGNIGRDPNDRLRFKVYPEGDKGKHAVTHYRVIERFGYVTVVECRLETGRTHQIRVHRIISAIRCSTMPDTAARRSARELSTRSINSSLTIVSPCVRARLSTPRPSVSCTRAQRSLSASIRRFRRICRL